MGVGGQAATQLEAVLTVRPTIREVAVAGRASERVEAFVARMAQALGDRFAARLVAARERGLGRIVEP